MRKGRLKPKILPAVLKFMRMSSGYSVEDIAKKLGIEDPAKVKSIEEGKDLFTITQIKKLSDIYKRPLAAFFSDKPPEIPESLPDYRINRMKKLTPHVYLAQRRAYYLSTKIAELGDKKSQIPNYPDNIKPESLAREFRKYLNVEQMKSKSPSFILSYYKNILEEKLAISIIEFPLKADDVRAFSINSDVSIIVINENDNNRIKLFSLFHEVCHLIKRSSAICSIVVEQASHDQIETFCNRFSAEFLVPEIELKREINKREMVSFDHESISKLANIYGVSKQVIMLRLLWLNFVDSRKYNEYKERAEKKEIKKGEFRKRNWDKVFYNRAGNLAIKEVSNSLRKGDITFFEAIDVLNMKSKYVEKFIS